MWNKLFVLVFGIIFFGCSSDYGITENPIVNDPGITNPEIEVDPLYHAFGALEAGVNSQDVTITIQNIGNGDLNIADVYLHGSDSNFTISSFPAGLVLPSGETQLIITYAPGTYETNYETISIISDDEDEPVTNILLDGSGNAPIITISPDYHDFGEVYVGCDGTLPIEIGNIGNLDLIISDIEYFASLPVDFSLENYEPSWGTLPITIAPGDTIDLNVDYLPLDDLDDSAYVEISSNDPATPIAYADQDGLGDYENWLTDSFLQDGQIDVDILFVIDNSGSMGGNQTNLKNNFDSFMNAFIMAGVSYQIGLITTDDDTFVGDVITTSTPDPVGEFNTQIDSIGTRGSAIEAGLWFGYQSTTTGDAAPSSSTGFFRTDSRLVIVYVSDEPDWSSYRGSLTAADYSASLLSLKSNPDLIIAHAIAGDYPSGCSTNGGAQFGDGYYDVVNDLGGTFMSICAEDWSVTMDTLATDSIARTNFELSGNSIEDTIQVEIDGILSADWTYDTSSNSVTLTTSPPEGSAIDITYAIWAECQ